MKSNFACGVDRTVSFWSLVGEGAGGDAAAVGLVQDLSFAPHSERVNCGVFNHNQQVLASASEDDTISLNVIGSSGPKSLGTLPKAGVGATAHGGKGVTSLTFSQGSRYLGSGGSDGTVKLWDLKQADTIRLFDQHRHAVSCVALNADDSYLVSADLGGALLMNRVLNKQTVELGPPPSPSGDGELEAYKSIHFSKLSPTSLATATDSGTVAVWDTKQAVRTRRWEELHFAPATAVRCCPDDAALLCSGGLDKRLLFLDVRAPSHDGAVVRSANADAPITAAEWVSTAGLKYVVIGTAVGTLSVYDVRMALQPCARAAVPRARRDPAQAVEWLAPRRVQLRSGASSSRRSRVPPSPGRGKVKQAAAAAADAPPMRTPSPQATRAPPLPPASAAATPTVRVSRHGSVDIRPQVQPQSQQPQVQPRAAAAARGRDEYRSAVPSPATTTTTTSSTRRAVAAPKPDLEPTTMRRAPAVGAARVRAEARAAAATALPASSAAAAAAAFAATPAAPASTATKTAAAPSSGGSGGFSLEGVARSMLQDELIDLRQTLHDDVQNMHLELIRQFQVQQQTLVALFTQQMGEMRGVVEENVLLRRENERLQLMYE